METRPVKVMEKKTTMERRSSKKRSRLRKMKKQRARARPHQ
jgi:hypothetical protein